MEYLFIDFENVAPESLLGLTANQTVFLFAGERQSKISLDLAETMHSLGPKAKLVRMKGSGKNALDFHIAFYIGKHSAIDPKASFVILSKDKGFDPLIKHLVSDGVKCTRIEKAPEVAPTKMGLRERIAEFGNHLVSLGEKRRPKKEAKLKAYIKNRIREDDAIVDGLFKGLVSGRHIEVANGKVTYASSPAENE